MNKNHYTYSIALWFVTMLYQQRQGMIHQARLKALAYLLQGLMALRQASLSGMGRGVVLANPETTFCGQLQRAHRLIKNPQLDCWEALGGVVCLCHQKLLELTMWFALIAMRQEGQTLVVVADRGFAKFDWIGECEQYPWMHLALRLKGNTIRTSR
jgi:hypothetical protein